MICIFLIYFSFLPESVLRRPQEELQGQDSERSGRGSECSGQDSERSGQGSERSGRVLNIRVRVLNVRVGVLNIRVRILNVRSSSRLCKETIRVVFVWVIWSVAVRVCLGFNRCGFGVITVRHLAGRDTSVH